MKERRDLELQFSDRTVRRGVIEIERLKESWVLRLHLPGLDARVYENDDQFEALKDLRRDLAGEGLAVLCAGARRDVFPSAMSREMSGGRKAYVCRMGSRGSADDLVDIFDPAPSDLIGSVEEQAEFHAGWFRSFA